MNAKVSRDISIACCLHVSCYCYCYYYYYYYYNRFTAPWTLSGTTWVSQYQKGETRQVKPIWI